MSNSQPQVAKTKVHSYLAVGIGKRRWMPEFPKSTYMRRRILWAYAFVTPPILAMLVFLVGPILFSGWVSLHRWDMLSPVSDMPWRGIDNYEFLLTKDTTFRKALLNSFKFALGGVGANVVLGLGIALLLNSRIKGRTVWRVLYFAPVVTAPLALAIMFSFIFDRNFGVANNIITRLGIPRQPFLSGPDQALLTLIFIAVYQYVGYYTVIFLAALQGIPQVYYDAAQIDGAGRVQVFRYITLPLLRPVMLFVVVTNTIGALQVFDLIFATTGGAPANTTMTVVLHMYNTAFKFSRMGRASAMAFILFGIIFVITIIQVRLLRDDTYEG